MFRCPRCNAELPNEARFCRFCGFNATNARLGVPPVSAAAGNPGASMPQQPGQPAQPSMVPQRILQVENKHVLPAARQMPASVTGTSSGTVPLTPPVSAPGTLPAKQPTLPSSPNDQRSLPVSPASTGTSKSDEPSPGLMRPIVVQPPKRPTTGPLTNANSANPSSTSRRISGKHLIAKTPLPAVPASFQPAAPGQAAPSLRSGVPLTPAGPQSLPAQTPAWPVSAPPGIAQPAQPSSNRGRQEPAGAGTVGMSMGRPLPGIVKGQQGVIQAGSLEGFESIIATSKAAEHWRESWRERQHQEAGPATSVSRGQAAVPQPLLAMQHSFARMRAIVLSKQEKQDRGSLAFWISILLMGCIILSLGAYIISTYLPENGSLTSQISSSSNTEQPGTPALSVLGTPAATITQGQVLHMQGKHFEVGDSIVFLLDTTIPINDASGRQLTATVSSQGTFTIAIPITTSAIWSAGAHSIEALDNHTQQNAYLNITIMLEGTPTTTGPFAFSLQGQPVTALSFTGVARQHNPAPQHVTLVNTTSIPFYWNATAFTDDNGSWLHIDDDHTGGLMQADGSDTLGIAVSLSGLKSSTKPYTGHIIFTLNSDGTSQQLTLPVELLVEDASAEMVFSPNPVVGLLAAGGTCSPGSSLTLINLGTSFITWNVNLDANAQGHVMFNGKSTLQGELAPSATTVLALTCNGVQAGQVYHMTISDNGTQNSAFVSIQTTPN